MKERPILFSGPMVRALLDGSKTQTRRVAKLPHDNPLGQWEPTTIGGENGGRTAAGETLPLQGGIWHTRTGDSLMCPHGQPGDRLWVRETHDVRVVGTELFHGERCVKGIRHYAKVAYRAGDGRAEVDIDEATFERLDKTESKGWAPSIHMPRWASRITLEVTGVRVERLQEISEADVTAEGWTGGSDPSEMLPLDWYGRLWDGLNAARGYGWDANPWVWVVEFKRVT